MTVADRPIIFSASMVLALLAGRKTMTRRLAWRRIVDPADDVLTITVKTALQKVQVGDRLYVREGFTNSPVQWHGGSTSLVYAADWPDAERQKVRETHGVRWRPSIFMPRAFSRLTLTVTDVKIEPLQDISYEDCRDEGTTCPIHGNVSHVGCMGLRRGFQRLWNSLHGEGTWETNPEVVALRFTVEHRNIDSLSDPGEG